MSELDSELPLEYDPEFDLTLDGESVADSYCGVESDCDLDIDLSFLSIYLYIYRASNS